MRYISISMRNWLTGISVYLILLFSQGCTSIMDIRLENKSTTEIYNIKVINNKDKMFIPYLNNYGYAYTSCPPEKPEITIYWQDKFGSHMSRMDLTDIFKGREIKQLNIDIYTPSHLTVQGKTYEERMYPIPLPPPVTFYAKTLSTQPVTMPEDDYTKPATFPSAP